MFYGNFIKMCNKIGKSPSAVALEIGASKGAVNRWKNGSVPTDSMVMRVADYFGVSVDSLLEKEEQKNKPTVNDDELTAEFIRLFSQLSPELQERELAYLRSLAGK